jgi:hypothetical protein
MGFDELIRSGMTVLEIKTNYPDTAAVFAKLKFPDSFDECSVEAACRKLALDAHDVVDQLNRAAFHLA